MTTIFAKTNDGELSAVMLPKIPEHGQNSVRLHVEFDREWDGYTRSAVFYTEHDLTPYEEILSSEGYCLIPPEVLTMTGKLYISVKGLKGGVIKPSTELVVKVLSGTPTLIMADPSPNMYQKLLTAYDVERARINNLAKLAEGSTTGDAELSDIRVGADGVTYETAGEAVREQNYALLNSVSNITRSIIYGNGYCPITIPWEYGGIHSSTGEDVAAYIYIRSRGYVTFEKDTEVTLTVKSGFAFVYTYKDGAFVNYKSYDSDKVIRVTSDKSYRFVLAPDNVDIMPSRANDYGTFYARVQQLSRLNGKRINVMGDSITSTDYEKPVWWEQISTKTGAVFNNYGQSGTTLAHTDSRHLWDYSFEVESAENIGYMENDPSTWNTGNCFVERVDEMDKTADAVIVMGGTNDNGVSRGDWNSTDTATFFGALNVLLKELLNTFSGKPVLFCTMIQTKNDYESNVADPLSQLLNKQSEDSLSLQLRAEAIKAKCRQYGVPCLDLFNVSGVNGADDSGEYYIANDSIHPSAKGQQRIATLVQSSLETLL